MRSRRCKDYINNFAHLLIYCFLYRLQEYSLVIHSLLRVFFEGISLYCPMLVLYYMRRSSLTFTSRHLATSIKFSKLGCALLVHHFDTAAWSTPICSANHLLVRFFSASTTFSDLSLYFPCYILLYNTGYKDNDFLAEIIKLC